MGYFYGPNITLEKTDNYTSTHPCCLFTYFLLNKACVFSTVLHRNRTLPKHPKRIFTKYHPTGAGYRKGLLHEALQRGTPRTKVVTSNSNVRPEPGRCCSCRPTTVPIREGVLLFVSNHLRNYNYKLYLENYTLYKILSLLLFTIIINNNYRPMKN
jgi:hypothetical protein